jgi:hypothetical protein
LVLLGPSAFLARGQTAEKLEVKRGKVVYVSGNDLVVKTDAGEVKHFTVPRDFKFTVDGKEVGIEDLRVGTELTQTITTTTKNNIVTNVRHVDAKVREVMAPYVTVTLADGTNKRVKVPDGTKFTIDGQEKTVFDLKPGMDLAGTIVTKTPTTTVSSRSRVTGKAPPVATPHLVGVLLFEEDVTAVE